MLPFGARSFQEARDFSRAQVLHGSSVLALVARQYTRDKDGKFASSGGPGSGQDLIAGGAGGLARTAALESPMSYSSADVALHHIAHEQGFDGPPRVVSKQEMDEIVAAGATETFRGVAEAETDSGPLSASDIHQQMRTGEAYFGNGMYGNGIYVDTIRGGAEEFSDGSPGSVARMALDRRARVVDYETLEAERAEYIGRLSDDVPFESSVFSDPGRYAAARGYDAIRITENSGTFYNVLNRTALYVESE